MNNFCFKGRDGELISAHGDRAKLAMERILDVAVFTKSTLKKAVEFVLRNCYLFKPRNIYQGTSWNYISFDPGPRTIFYLFISMDSSIKDIALKAW